MPGHDQLFKDLLRAFFADFLSLVVPEQARRLDLTRATFLDKEIFTDLPRGERRELDLLAEVPVAAALGETVLIHVEVEAAARVKMKRRLWSYFSYLQVRHDLPILSVVVYLEGGRPGIHLEPLEYRVLGEVRGRFDYTAFGISGSRAEDYLDRPEPLAWGLAALMKPHLLSRSELKLVCLRRITAAGLDEVHRFLLVNCVETYLQLTPEETAEYDVLRASRENREIYAMEMTWADKLEAKGIEIGRREEREAGLRTLRQVLLRQLEQRFGPLGEAVTRRVEEISSMSRLGRLAEQVLVARSLEEMGLG